MRCNLNTNNTTGANIMTNSYKDSSLAYEKIVQNLSHSITFAYNNSDFDEVAKLIRKQDQAVVDMNYFIGLHLKQLKES